VDHPAPDEVTVTPPELPPTLTFAQSRKETRGGRWTLAEFWFVPHRTGAVTLGSFEVQTPAFRIRTEELRTYVTAAGGSGAPEEYHPRLVWDALPAAVSVGEPLELSLYIRDWEPGRNLRPGPFRVTAPAAALLEELPLSPSDREQGRVLRIRLTPLENAAGERTVSLGPFTLRFDTLRLEAPALSIRLRPPAPGNAAPIDITPGIIAAETQGTEGSPPPFPEAPDEPFPLFRKAYEETLDRARELWGRALYAEALVELRRGERDLCAGPALAAPRRAAEQALGLARTEGGMDEKWRPRNFFLALTILSFCLLLLTILLPLRERRRGRGVKKGVPYGFVLLLLAGIFGVGIAELAPQPGPKLVKPGVGGFPLEKTAPETGYSRRSFAVLRAGDRETVAAYRVPDTQGAISARWMEGQPVRIRAAAGSWAYAESPDGDAGWVPQNNLIFY
jgi:hypothetical protein